MSSGPAGLLSQEAPAPRVAAGALRDVLAPAALMLAVAALAYLPYAGRFGYFNDDWYLMYSAGAHGPGIFWSLFAVDRPLRALVMIPAYSLFGAQPLGYVLSAFVFRVLGALGLFSLFDTLWPRWRGATALMALLYLVYPGFLSQPNSIDYQSHIVGLAAAAWSIVFTIRAVRARSLAAHVLWFALSILLGWLYLGQMEWYIGFEYLRWAAVFLLAGREGGSLRERVVRTLRRGYPALLVPLVFLLWRLFFFHAARGATDVGAQLAPGNYSLPVAVLLRLVYLLKDVWNVAVAAWGTPLYLLTASVDLKGFLLGLGIAAVAAACAAFWLLCLAQPAEELAAGPWQIEAAWLGLGALVFGLLPVVLVNRHVVFPSYSRYTLVAAAGATVLLVALLYQLSRSGPRIAALTVLVFVAVLTQYENSAHFAQVSDAMRSFWWQVAWRVPQFDEHTTLVARYAVGAAEEDYFVWGPANLIYYPAAQSPDVNQPVIYAALLNTDTVNNILTRQRQEFDNRRGIRTYKNYRQVVVLSQPTPESCVHLLDRTALELSSADESSIRLIAPFSDASHVLVDAAPHTPPGVVFGPEPEHDWCYYYERASLARQRNDLAEVQRLGSEAVRAGLAPTDPIEWLPFLEAEALNGGRFASSNAEAAVVGDPFAAQQACRVLTGLPNLLPAVRQHINEVYCSQPGG